MLNKVLIYRSTSRRTLIWQAYCRLGYSLSYFFSGIYRYPVTRKWPHQENSISGIRRSFCFLNNFVHMQNEYGFSINYHTHKIGISEENYAHGKTFCMTFMMKNFVTSASTNNSQNKPRRLATANRSVVSIRVTKNFGHDRRHGRPCKIFPCPLRRGRIWPLQVHASTPHVLPYQI